MPRKRTWLLIAAVMLLVGVAARGPISSTLFEWYLKGYCRTCLGSRLTYESLRYENDQWIFEHPVLTTKKRLEEGGYRFQADQAAVDASISWIGRTLNLTVNADNPHLDIGREAEDIKTILSNPAQTFHMFDVHTQFHVPSGTILVHDFTNDDLVPIPLFFHICLTCKETRQGSLAFWFGEQTEKQEGLLATFLHDKEPTIRFQLKDVECSALQQVLKGLWPDATDLEIIQGSLNGHVDLVLPAAGASYAKGNLILKDLVAYQQTVDAEVHVPEISLHLNPRGTDQTQGNIEIHPSQIVFKRGGDPFWVLHTLSGTASFNAEDYANFSLNGKVVNRGKQRKLSIDGQGRFAQNGQASFSMNVNLVDIDAKEDSLSDHTSFHFSARKLNDQWSFGEVELLGMGVDEIDLAQHVISGYYPQWQYVHLDRGNLDAALLVYLKDFRLSEVKIERIAAHRLAFAFHPWNLYSSVDSAWGSLSFDFSQDHPLKTLNADFKVNKGTLSLEGLDKAIWQLAGVDTHLKIRQGVVQKSLLKGKIAGLVGEIELDGTTGGPFAIFNFRGKVQDFSLALPDLLRKNLEKHFTDNDLKIIAQVRKIEEEFVVQGKTTVESKDAPQEDILFGFSLERSSQNAQETLCMDPYSLEYGHRFGFETIRGLPPAIAMPIYSAYCHLISSELSFPRFSLKNGWVTANSLPLNKYLSSLLFRNDQMHLSGVGNFSGHFDEHKFVLNYDARDLVLENSDFSIEIKSLSGESSPAADTLIATYTFDFHTKSSLNTFPIRNATYFEKNTGLLYTEINALLDMKDAYIHFSDLTAFCNGLYFAGSADIDWSMPGEGVFEVDLYGNEMHGKVSQLQHLLSHINKSLVFLKIPLEGSLALNQQGGHLHFAFRKDDYDLESHIQGTMTDGAISGQNVDLSLQELSMNFDYHHQGNRLEFSDIQGTLLVGKPNHVEEYIVTGDKVRFTDYLKNEAEFDVWAGSRKRDILRIAGKTRTETDENGQLYTNVILNRSLSHFGDVHPSTFLLGFKDWSQLEVFQLTFEFDLKTLLNDLQRFSRTGLFFLSRGLLKEINDIESAKGTFKADLNYDTAHSSLNFHFDGADIALGNRGFKEFQLSGKKKGNLWSVDQLQLDHISLAFDVLKEGSLWNINFLGARLGDSLLIGMEGQYSDEDARLEARVNLLEVDLARLNEWSPLDLAVNSAVTEGQLRVSGLLNAELDKSMPHGVRANMQMTGSLNHPKIQGISLEDIKNLSLHYDSTRGASLKNVQLAIKSDQLKASLFLQEASYDTIHKELILDGLHFDIPAENLPWFAQQLHDHFPDKITQPVADVIQSCKTHDPLQGSIRLSISEPYSSLRLHLNKGLYQFMGTQHDLNGFVMDYDPFAVKVFTEYYYQRKRLRLDAHSSASELNSGEIILSELSEDGGQVSSSPLTVFWKIHPQIGYYIEKMFGELSGAGFNLVRDPNQMFSPDFMQLTGRVNVDLRRASGLFDDQMVSKIANWELGEGYSLFGNWSIVKGNSKSLADSLFFQGELAGHNFELLGYRFEQLTAQAAYSPEATRVQNMTIVDKCGSMRIGQVDLFNQGDGIWQVVIPSIAIADLKPRLLNSNSSSFKRTAKSLVIRNLEVQDISGILGDRNSFTGRGQLSFANPPKKNPQPGIFAIPAELLTRIGLDLAVLTPVRGTVIFDIRDGKASLKRFKDMYSKGKLSKFYLPNGHQSYVDFDGNLNVQVRMKQYNLIFKLAELFTVTVQGTLTKPTYALQKQQRQEEVANTQ